MPVNRGKQFEKVIQKTLEQIEDVDCTRLYDQVSGFVEVSKNPSDFIVYKYPYRYYVECKTTHGASIPINNLTQLNRIAEKCNKKGVFGKFIIWFVDKQETYWVDYRYILTWLTLKRKSINHTVLREVSKENNLVKLIPAKYARVFGKYEFSTIWEK